MKHMPIILAVLLLAGCETPPTSNEVLLHRAAEGDELELVKKLVTAGVDKNVTVGKWRDTPLHRAVLYNNREVIIFLINSEADLNIADAVGGTIMDDAIFWNEKDIIELLRSRGAKTAEELKNENR
ncbi:MAG: ankyrin repeat domain-containing protein [Verrucomicrobiota bacterium]|nr:ankyrin repeat domain-containing protein [Verrucomicrobiota bacterium]